MSNRYVRISQCMIVKNEEKNIERALSWGKSIMWEQIVVDTGSTDRTVEIALQLGASVFEFPWIDDFAAAKNYAIEQCSGDWIALLDADEYMSPEDVKKIPPIMHDLNRRKLDGLSTSCKQLNDEGNIFAAGTQVRFFRNTPEIRYRRRIHEQLECVSGRKLRLGDGVKELSIFHTGYQSANMVEKKNSGRNKRLIIEELKANPVDYEMMGYMGDEYRLEGDKEGAEMWYRRSIEYMPSRLEDNDQRSSFTFTNLLMILSEKTAVSCEQVKEVYEKAVKLLPQDADFDYVVGYFHAVKGRNEEAVLYLEAALKKLDRYGFNNKAFILAGNLLDMYELLVRCYSELGQKEKCAVYAIEYLKNDKYVMAVLVRLLKVLIPENQQGSDGEYKAVLKFLGEIYEFTALKDKLFVLKATSTSGMNKFADFIMTDLFTAGERELLGI